MEYKEIIEPVKRGLIIAELTEDRMLKRTQSGSNIIYVIDAQSCPNTMREIGRLREISFRDGGGGTGESIDIDESDLAPEGYKQLLVWDPEMNEIIGGYRFIVSKSDDTPYLSTEHYFTFSKRFRKLYLPYMLELGRSFVQPHYQGRKGNRKGIFALDNLWEGIGAIAARNSHVKYFFGKVTMYPRYNSDARNELIYFLKKYFADAENLVKPINPSPNNFSTEEFDKIYIGNSYNEDYKILVRRVREYGENVPPLINAYMNVSPSMKVFDTIINKDFGDVEETGILITIDELYSHKYERYIENVSKEM